MSGGDPAGWHPETLLVRGGIHRSGFRETSEPIYLTQGFVYESAEQAEAAFKGEVPGYVYSRYGNPTVSIFEERLALLEGAEACRATASGMAAVFAALACQVRAGDRVVASRALFGSCHFVIAEILPRYGVETILVDGADLDQWREALSRPTRAVFLESPSNPMLDLVDIAAVAPLAHAAGARLIVDNVFATPLHQKPLELGADIVVYSATKHIDGQGRCLGGAILADKAFIEDVLTPFYRHTGPSLSPFNAWVMAKGLETLPVRVERQIATARALAEFLEGHPGISMVRYPGLPSHPQAELASRQMTAPGNLIAIEVAGGKEGAFRLLNGLSVVDISNNLGDAKSLVTHPATTTHRAVPEAGRLQLGITDGVVRLSVGLEHVDDLKADFDRALSAR